MEVPAPQPSNENARLTMQANRRKDTTPELAVRRRLHAAGPRYRVDFPADATDRRRRADIVFTRVKVTVFIDGRFWHGCPEHFIPPKSNADYWGPKIARNMERDRTSTARLSDAGWRVLRFWEHEDPDDVAARIIDAVRPRNRILPPDVSHRR
ncbi:very short patch repair endonuclease [Brachybacterium sp. GPGPB12]|uniref:very short patch repair endonuclease n=1 Tax=Brachybacterium sp. GPGPB12 TaxID=3023517 RepID=UPI003134486F